MEGDLQKVLDWCVSQDIPVDITSSPGFRLPYDVRFHVSGQAVWNQVVLIKHDGQVPEDVLAWTVLHEAGHVQQMRSGFLTFVKGQEAYSSWGHSSETVRYELDAWNKAGRIAAELGVEVTHRARQFGRFCLRNYKKSAGLL